MRHGAARPRQARGRFADLIARVGVILTAVAFLAQSLALAAPERPQGAAGAAAELTALFGPGVVICAQAGDEPGQPPHGCDACPLCRLASDAGALDAPRFAELPPPYPTAALRLDAPEPSPPRPWTPPFPLPRGPPVAT